ncbi:hypothetical protein GCM10023340_40950 [Nocardioides marinquilinus]|uniref:DUF3558 domain-containing protein n=1 Tax=Nocardioides marinquilinus TaxID=1210400 RepID=A0ABP9Q1N9_9ACTN
MRRAWLAPAGAAVLALGLGGCAGGDEPPLGQPPDLPDAPPALWNPCDGLDVPGVDRLFDTAYTAAVGTPAAPRCTFTPDDEGDPAVDVNYQLFPGTLDDLFDSFGDLAEDAQTEVEPVDVPRADDASIVTDVDDEGDLAITGFVQNGDLVQVVNVTDAKPFDRETVRRGVLALLKDLAAHGADSGLSGESSGDGDGVGSD